LSEIKIVGTYLTPEQRQKFYQKKRRMNKKLEEKFQQIIQKMMERQK